MDGNGQAKQIQQEKKLRLFLQQKQTLDIFLKNGAISQAQYNKSLGDLREKMGINEAISERG